MNAAPEQPSSEPAGRTAEETLKPEIGPTHKREMLLQRVRAARKRLTAGPSAVPRLR